MEFLRENWVWILLGLGVMWLLVRRTGMGCGMAEHGFHASSEPRASMSVRGSHDGHEAGGAPGREGETAAPRSRRGCC